MLFRDLEVGATFKFKKEGITNEGETRVKVYPIGFGKSLGYIDTRLHHVYTFDSLGEEEVLTLQKVTKTEKKWVEKKLWGLEGNSKFKFGGCVCTKLINRIERENGSQIIGAVYVDDKHRVKICYYEHQMVLVEEDTVVETEEWLP